MRWPMVEIKTVADIVTGKTPSKSDNSLFGGTMPFITPVELTNSNYLLEPKQYLSEKGVKVSKIIPKNSILVCCIGSLGKIAIADKDVVTNQQINSVTFDPKKVDYKYGFYALKLLKNELINFAPSTTVPIVNKSRFSEMRIPLPSLSEQKHISTILDHVNSIITKRDESIKIADTFLRATFLKMFGELENNPKNFPVGTIRDLVSSVSYGSSGKASEHSGRYPILRMGNITYQGGWDFKDLKYIDLDEKSKDKFLVRKGDLLFNRTNSKELVGKTAVFENDIEMAYAGYLVRVRANDLGNNYYISGYLNSLHGKSTLINMSKSIVGMANINAQEMQNIKILIPPKELQDKYEVIYKTVKSKVDTHIESKEELEKLFNTLINKFFN
ncbi:restriction endonuclease subunit S [Klebsiella aerogenes]|uniref:restriction endonuclease subunit S n=1 Tax=Klebsiella aerogenes TaxID=548 RepID=UPI001CC5A18C|nr:restriction endonuclease subunit S [Klebsiella aerogenes]MDN3793991.1 restriction endonuclease subunit S [Klebsiella aerogenes]UNX73319.1 restriction endonuclease subunit S [Klebsiella aerogenes]